MEYRVKYSEQAAEDLDRIMEYISDVLCNPQAAESFYQTVNKKLSLLRKNPHMFPIHHDEKLREEKIRFVAIGNYLMFYKVDDDCAIASVSRILYGRQDISSIF